MTVHAYLPDLRLAREVVLYMAMEDPVEEFRFLRANALSFMLDPVALEVDGQPVRGKLLACSQLSQAPLMRKAPGRLAMVTLAQGAWRRLLGIDPRTIDKTIVALDLAEHPELARLHGELAALADDPRAQVAALDRFFLALLETAEPHGLAEAGYAILYRDHTTPIAALAKRLGVSQRKLERAFNRRFGITPGRRARILRAFRSMGDGAIEDMQWSNVPPEIEYADQSHWIRDIRRLYGLTPGEIATQTEYPWTYYPRPGTDHAPSSDWEDLPEWQEFFAAVRTGVERG